MKTILLAVIGIPLMASFGLVGPADAASTKQRGYTVYCHGTPDQCMRGYRATRQKPRGYLPVQGRMRGYDFPRYGSQRWWRLQEDEN